MNPGGEKNTRLPSSLGAVSSYVFQLLGSRRALQEGTWIGAGQILIAIGRLVGLRLITTLATPSTYGNLMLLMGLSVLFRDVFLTPVLSASLRFYPDAVLINRTRSLRDQLSRMLTPTALVAAALLCGAGAIWIQVSGGDASFWVLLFLCAVFLFDSQRAFETSLLNAARHQRAFTLWTLVDAWAQPLAAVAFILLLGPRPTSILLGYACAAAIVNIVFRLRVVHLPAPSLEPDAVEWISKTRQAILHYAIPLAPLAIFGWIVNLADRYILAELASAAEVGIYAAAYGLASQPFLLPAGIVATTLRPILFEAFAANDPIKTRRTLQLWVGLLVVAFVPGIALILVLSEFVVGLVLGPSFWEASTLLVWLAAAHAIQGIQQAFAAIIYADGRTKLFIVVHGVTAASALVLYLLLIPAYGMIGAALATLGAKIISCSMTLALSGARRHLTPDSIRSS